jgi:hypothetical protein
VIRWLAATVDGVVEGSGAVFEAKFMLPWSFSEEAAAEKHMAQLQHNMWVTNATLAVLSVITGGGKWVEISVSADRLHQHLLLTAEKKFWRCVESGEPPRLFGVEPPRARIAAVRIVDMASSNSWAPRRPGKLAVTQHRESPGPRAPRTVASVDKSMLALREPRRYRDKEHRNFVCSQPCLVCGRTTSDAHHLGFAQPRAFGLKVSDEFTVPLCRGHHRALHRRARKPHGGKKLASTRSRPLATRGRRHG